MVFEGDSTTIIDALRYGLGELTSYGNVLDDIQVFAFQFFYFNLVSRLCNSTVDGLPKKASLVVGLQVWLGDLPTDIAPLVFCDVH